MKGKKNKNRNNKITKGIVLTAAIMELKQKRERSAQQQKKMFKWFPNLKIIEYKKQQNHRDVIKKLSV